MDLSVILPCYNSAPFIERRVLEFEAVLKNTCWSWEILLCDDGSRDATPDICRRLADAAPNRRFLPSPSNRGRGRNVSDGIQQSRGEIVGFADSDFSTAASYVIPLVMAIQSGFEVAEAHRTYKIRFAEFPFIAHRYGAHLAYSGLVRLLLGLRGHDTETGFKFFRRAAGLKLLELSRSSGWFWDTEVIANAHRLGYRVAEIPSLFVRTKGMGSTVRLMKDAWSQWRHLQQYRRDRSSGRAQNSCCQKNA